MEAEQLPVLPSRWKNDFITLMLGFLEENGYAKSMKALEEESGLRKHRFGAELTFLRELILSGDFPAAETFIEPLKGRSSEEHKTVLYALRKQYVLESFDAEGGSVSVDDIVGKLQKLDELCSEEEMNDLCYCMTLSTVQEHPSYATWTVHRGRLECFHLVYSKLWCLYPSTGSEHTPDSPLLAGSEARTETILRQAAAWEQQHAPEDAASEGKHLRWQEPCEFDILGYSTPSRHDAGKGEAAVDWENEGVTASLPASVPRLRTSTLPAVPSGTPTSPQPHLTSWWARRSVAAGTLSGGFSYSALRDAKLRSRSKTQPLPFEELENDGNDEAPAQDQQDVAPQVQGNRDNPGAMQALCDPAGGLSVELPSPSREAPIASLDQHCFDLTPTSTPVPSGARSQGVASAWSAERTPIEASSHMGGPERKPEALPIRLPDATTGNGLQSPELQPEGIQAALPDTPEPAEDSVASQKLTEDSSATSVMGLTRAPTGVRRRSSLQEAATYEALNPRNDFVAMDVTSDKQAIRTINFSPRRNMLAVGTNSRALRVLQLPQWDRGGVQSAAGLGRPRLVLELLDHHQGSIFATEWGSGPEHLLASCSNDQTIKVVRLQEEGVQGDDILQVESTCVLKGHDGTVRDLCFDSNAAEKLLSGGAGDCKLRVWDIAKQSCLSALDGHWSPVVALRKGSANTEHADSAFSLGADGSILQWDLRVGKAEIGMQGCQMTPSEAPPSSLAVNQANQLAVGYADGRCGVLDLRTGKQVYTLSCHSLDCRSVDFDPSGRWLLTGGFDHTVGIIEAAAGRVAGLWKRHVDKVVQCRWCPHMPGLASSSADKSVKLWIPLAPGVR